MPELRGCFTAPKTDPATCPHQNDWKFSWMVREPVFRTHRGRCQAGTQTVQFVVCMACDTLLVNGSVYRKATDWQTLPPEELP